jgi:hypothetical protein
MLSRKLRSLMLTTAVCAIGLLLSVWGIAKVTAAEVCQCTAPYVQGTVNTPTTKPANAYETCTYSTTGGTITITPGGSGGSGGGGSSIPCRILNVTGPSNWYAGAGPATTCTGYKEVTFTQKTFEIPEDAGQICVWRFIWPCPHFPWVTGCQTLQCAYPKLTLTGTVNITSYAAGGSCNWVSQ